jgi:hypothetical protein
VFQISFKLSFIQLFKSHLNYHSSSHLSFKQIRIVLTLSPVGCRAPAPGGGRLVVGGHGGVDGGWWVSAAPVEARVPGSVRVGGPALSDGGIDVGGLPGGGE